MPSDPLNARPGEAALPKRVPRPSDTAPEAIVQLPRWRASLRASLIAAYSFAGLFLFVLALQLLKSGAGGLKPILKALDVHGPVNTLGFGWLGAYGVMSGSPVAAISLSLFSKGTISDIEAFAMINGSRLGASFIVLFVGFLQYVMQRRTADGLFIGVVALLVAFTLWLPVLPMGIFVLKAGWFDSIRLGTPPGITSIINVLYDPIVHRIDERLPALAMFAIGVAVLLLAFAVFDRALPNLEQPSLKVERIKEWLHHPLAMFALGLAITAVTMSVSLSVTLLIPLSLKGYVRRDNIIPYVMGANISTWVDTLVAALLLDSPRAFTIVFTEMVTGGSVSLLVLLFAYKPYSRLILSLARQVTHTRRGFALFLGAILLIPLVLFLL
jgi:solute carrier family 34 (sodium-dependent phosphate cotransporter)